MPNETLKAANRELNNIRHALDQSAIVAITDCVGNIIHVNDKFCQISRYPREELMGRNHRVINSGLHSREFFVDMWKTISSGKTWEGEIRNLAKDGTHYWVNTTIVPFLDDEGTPYQYVSIRYEITQRKRGEEQLKSYADKLEASNQELQDFASIAAHDLQEPLRKIQAFGDRLKTRFREALASDGQNYLDRMLGSARRMQTLIDDLLTYSRVKTKTQPFVHLDLNGVMKDVISDLELRIEQSHASITIDPLPTLEADPSQMRQLFQNLLTNALKFHQPGVAPKIRIQAFPQGDAWHLQVTDQGIGFDPKYLDRIFTIFQRLHGKLEYEGTGVGLAVCKRIAERHGGTITATSQSGKGATFIVTLPIHAKES